MSNLRFHSAPDKLGLIDGRPKTSGPALPYPPAERPARVEGDFADVHALRVSWPPRDWVLRGSLCVDFDGGDV